MPPRPRDRHTLTARPRSALRAIGFGRAVAVLLISFVCGGIAASSHEGADERSAPRPEQRPRDGSGKDGATRDRPRLKTLSELIGQRLVTRMSGRSPSPGLRRRLVRGEVGGIILFADNLGTRAATEDLIRNLRQLVTSGGNPRLWVMVDQEGGRVRRLPELPPVSSAAELGQQGRNGTRGAGAATGAELRSLGIDVDLAPVADVARVASGFLGDRAFGRNLRVVTENACAFAIGLGSEGVIPTLKHFPGLGRARRSTDDEEVRIDASAEQLRKDYRPYERCANDGLVMISSAIYPSLLGPLPAVLEKRTYEVELARTGFDGLTISDDLSTPAFADRKRVFERAAGTGLDLLLVAGSEQASAAAFEELIQAARDGRIPRPQLVKGYRRVRDAKRASAATRDDGER